MKTLTMLRQRAISSLLGGLFGLALATAGCKEPSLNAPLTAPGVGGSRGDGGGAIGKKQSLTTPLTDAGSDGSAADGMPFTNQDGVLCTSDADCGNPYLTCALPPGTVCGPVSDPPVNDAGYTCGPGTFRVCTARYNLPCQVDTDCGPAGFACINSGCGWVNGVPVTDCPHCEPTGSGPCSSDGDCPQGWSCFSPCPCPTGTPLPKSCNPPFETWACPVCIVASVDGG
jgi:hypothetical protein